MDFGIITFQRYTISGAGAGLCNGLLKTEMLLKISETYLKKKQNRVVVVNRWEL